MANTITNKIFLVGPMGAGKSAVGRRLASDIGFEFADADDWVEARTGVDIAYIFEREGEVGFRKRETHALDTLSQQDKIVLATGGGAVGQAENRNILTARGFVVYLFASVAQQYQRVRYGHDRPMLHTDDPRARLKALFEQREPWYEQVADLKVTTDGRRVAEVARAIVALLPEASTP
ncbi:MAG: shikimate kinase [Pseudomonadota bacterium]